MSILTAFFILTWYEASAPWWVAFWVVLGFKSGWFLMDEFEPEIKKFLGEK